MEMEGGTEEAGEMEALTAGWGQEMEGGWPAWLMASMCGGGKGWGGGGGGKKGGKKGGSQKGKVEYKIMSGHPVYHGQVKCFNVEKKSGYIVCEAIFNESGGDVYAYEDVLQRGSAGPGDTVCFFVHWSAKGQPQASSPLLRLATPDGWALKGTYKAAKDPASAFAFIDCPETKEFFGRDVYVNKDLAGTVGPGEAVRFNIYLNRDGMPNAHTMEACEQEWEPVASDLSQTVHLQGLGYGQQKGGWKGGGGYGGGTQRAKGAPIKGGKGSKGGNYFDFEAGVQLGMRMAAKGQSMGMSPDEASGLAEAAISAAVQGCGNTGSMGDTGKGKSKGKGKGKGGGEGSKPTPTGQAYTGVVKSFNEANNYGFIECEEVKAAYGNDVFAHGKELQGRSVGEGVFFELGVSSKGQPQAMNVQALGADGSAPAAKKRRLTPGLQAHGGSQEDEAVLSAIAESMGHSSVDAWAAAAGGHAGTAAEALLGGW